MYKLIALDLDGTLLNDSKEISSEDIKYLQELESKGYSIVLATGRRHFSAVDYGRLISEDIDIISSNGNVIRQARTGQLLHGSYMDYGDYEKVIQLALGLNMHPVVHIDNYDGDYDIIIDSHTEDEKYHNYFRGEARIKTVESFLDPSFKVLSVVFLGRKKDLNYFEERVNVNLKGSYRTHLIENILIAEGLLEIMNPVGNKWTGLVEYARIKAIDPKHILSIGDDNNDIEMIKYSKMGIAMKNGRPSVLEVADCVSEKDNNNSGVSDILRRVL